MVLFFLSGVIVASATLYDDISHTRKSNIHVSHGRAYALTIMANVLIKIPTPPSLTPGTSALTGVVFHVDYPTYPTYPSSSAVPATRNDDRRRGNVIVPSLATNSHQIATHVPTLEIISLWRTVMHLLQENDTITTLEPWRASFGRVLDKLKQMFERREQKLVERQPTSGSAA